MANTDILTLTPEFGLTESVLFNTNITESESGKERRDALWDDGLREYDLKVRFLTKANMDTIWDFYIARKGSFDHFLVKFETAMDSEDENVGSGDGSTTQFLLNHFPVDTAANNSCTVNSVAETNYALSNDFNNEESYITFDTAPVTGTILVTYQYYFKVRFADDKLTRELAAYQLLHAGMKLLEVRWDSYAPSSAGGNA
jgi:uncharacterized protein (TIGR02217 family)